MTRQKERQLKAALKFANKVRKKMGKKPVTRLRKGHKGYISACPIARTIDLKGRVYVVDIKSSETVEANGKSSPFVVTGKSKTLYSFVVDFDGGKIPELEL